jgi:hypothetical protein
MTLAMEAAARGEPYHIIHGGSSPLNYAGDVARLFVRAARAVPDEHRSTTPAARSTTCVT